MKIASPPRSGFGAVWTLRWFGLSTTPKRSASRIISGIRRDDTTNARSAMDRYWKNGVGGFKTGLEADHVLRNPAQRAANRISGVEHQRRLGRDQSVIETRMVGQDQGHILPAQ